MNLWPVTCALCGGSSLKAIGEINRAERRSAPLYCDRQCAGLARRKHRSDSEKMALKAAYDAERRVILADKIRADKAAYHRRTYDPEKAAVQRQKRMPYHVEYCRRPEYRAKKADYDRRRRDHQNYGDFAESATALRMLETEVLSRASRYEIDLAKGALNKATKRKRDYEASVCCRS